MSDEPTRYVNEKGPPPPDKVAEGLRVLDRAARRRFLEELHERERPVPADLDRPDDGAQEVPPVR